MPINLDLYRSVVLLSKFTPESGESRGSGVVFSPTGLVITNNHVIENSDLGDAFGHVFVDTLESVDRPPSGFLHATVIIRNEVYDLAIVQIEGTPPPCFIDLLNAPPIDMSLIERHIRILGYPSLGGDTITVTRGIVSGFDGRGNLKTDAECNPGNSGGAAFDDEGTFLGIPRFNLADGQGKLGFIISVDRIKEWFGTALKSGVPKTTKELATAFEDSNLNLTGENLDRLNKDPYILIKVCAAEYLISKGENEKAIRKIEYILDRRPHSGLAHHLLGLALFGLGRYLEAFTQFKTSLEYNPGYVPSLVYLSDTLHALGRSEQALSILEEIPQHFHDPAQLRACYMSLGKIYKTKGQADLSREFLHKATELNGEVQDHISKFLNETEITATSEIVAELEDALIFREIYSED
jgi:predicted Zn-dependent protease